MNSKEIIRNTESLKTTLEACQILNEILTEQRYIHAPAKIVMDNYKAAMSKKENQ